MDSQVIHQQSEYPIYNADNYDGLNRGAHIRINHSVRQSGSASDLHFPEDSYIKKSRVMKIKCTCDKIYDKQKCCCNCGAVVCPGPLTSTSSRLTDQVIKGQSRIQYVPYEKKAVDYVDQERYILKEVKKTQIDYKQEKIIEYQPREVTVNDYYAIQYIRCYIPQVIPQKYVECVPFTRKNRKNQYIPVERQILHYPVHSHDDEAPRYLGVRRKEGPKTYENISQETYQMWQRQYGYKKGEPISQLNKKIREKHDREKQQYFSSVSQKYKTQNNQALEEISAKKN